MSKTFLAINFGCRVNMAETNQWSQTLINQGYSPSTTYDLPSIIFINTCSITKKGDIESLSKVRILHQKYPKAKIYVTGCANLEKLKDIPNIIIYKNDQKEEILEKLNSFYTPQIKDKFSHTNRFLLKVQSGCSQFCSYCIVPQKRPKLWSLPTEEAIKTINSAISNGYKEVIITGVNLNQYQFGFSNLVEKLLEETNIELISFGSIPINCIDNKFISLLKNPKYKNRFSNFFHIPIQSGSDKILKLMNRPYTQKDILQTFNKIKEIFSPLVKEGIKGRFENKKDLSFGTDIIVGFPGETNSDFQETLDICKTIGFKKIHCFRYSSRPNTLAKNYYDSQPKIDKEILIKRSQQIRNLPTKLSNN